MPINSDSTDQTIIKLLKLCQKAGYNKVTIHQQWNQVKSSENWSRPDCQGSVFVSPAVRTNHFPPIWGICRELGIFGGAGNAEQAQVTLICEPQSWKLVKNKWAKVNIKPKPAWICQCGEQLNQKHTNWLWDQDHSCWLHHHGCPDGWQKASLK